MAALEHTFRALFAKPLAAAIFLTINGLILLAAEVLRRRAATEYRRHDRQLDAQAAADVPPRTGGVDARGDRPKIRPVVWPVPRAALIPAVSPVPVVSVTVAVTVAVILLPRCEG